SSTRPFPSDGLLVTSVDRLNRAFSSEILRPVVRQGHLQLQATQYVGVVRFGNCTFQILPKIHREASSEPAREATHNLLHLLAYAGEVPIHESEIAQLAERTS